MSTVKVEIRNWEGGSQGDLESFVFRKSNVRLQNGRVIGHTYTANVPHTQSSVVQKLDRIQFAGKKLEVKLTGSYSQETQNTVQTLQAFLDHRYNPQARLLDLTNIRNDPILVANNLYATPSAESKVFPALMKIAADRFKDIESMSLDENDINDVSSVNELAISFPNLLNLSLQRNKLVSAHGLQRWRRKFLRLRELLLFGNPISDNPKEMKDVISFFPRLQSLNGVVVRSEADVLRLPIPVQQTFFETPEIQNLVQNFLATFFNFWDNDRSQLTALYDDASEFSLYWDGLVPHNHLAINNNRWVPVSRNLTRMTASNRNAFINNKVSVGPQRIAETFRRLPKSKHDLTDADKFAIEAYAVSGIRQPGDSAIMVSVHGSFTQIPGPREHGNKHLSFDRSLVILPAPGGNMLLASDLLTVRGPADSKIFKTNQEAPAPAGTSPAPVPVPVPGPVVPGLTPEQQQVVAELVQQTRLNQEFALQCCQQANFDLQAALQLFQQHRTSLPQDAFI